MRGQQPEQRTPAPFGLAHGAVLADRPCHHCGVHLWFTSSASGRAVPREKDGTNHFTTCPAILEERAKKEEAKRAAAEQQPTLFDVGRKFEYPR